MQINLKTASERAYSILELSISIAIISAIVASGFSMVTGSNNLSKRKDTQKRMQVIEKAIASFVMTYNRLPCPADITLADSNANSGLEYCYNNYASGSPYVAFIQNVASSLPTTLSSYAGVSAGTTVTYSGNNNLIKHGTVPYIALGLPKEYVADAWGNKFVYSMSLSMAGIVSSATYGTPSTKYTLETTNMGLINIVDSNSVSRSNNAAYVLMSVGDNGYGGYQKSSSTRNATTPTDANELINYNGLCGSTSVNTGCGKFAALEQTSTYDDIVRYRQKWQIVKDAGAVLSNSTCTLMKTYIETADVTYSSVNYSPVCTVAQQDPRCSVFANSFLYKMRDLCLLQF